MNSKYYFNLGLLFFCLFSSFAYGSQSITVPMFLTETSAQNIGNITFEKNKCGVLITPNLHDLPPGVHGFHIHEQPSCDHQGMAAGSHLDPADTTHHLGPYNHHGHLGDLPALIVNADGTATLPVLAPKIKLSALKGHAIMVHAGSDNYADTPEKNGGGGDRYACGVIK